MSASGYATPTQLLRCNVSPTETPWQLKVELINQSKQPVVILRWYSPLDAWFSEFLHITQQDQKLLYQGAKAKRGNPSAEDLLVLLPDERHTELLDLTNAYQLRPAAAMIDFLPFAVLLHQPDQPLHWQPAQQQWLQCPQLYMPASGTAI